jgi:flagellar hook-basal body complex protein FliE
MASHLIIYLILTLLVVAGVVVVSELSRKGTLTPSKTPSKTPDRNTTDTPGPGTTLDPTTSTPSAADMTTLIIVLSVTVPLVILVVFLFMKFGRIQSESVGDKEGGGNEGVGGNPPNGITDVSLKDDPALENIKTVHTNGTTALKKATDNVGKTLKKAKDATGQMEEKARDQILPQLNKAEVELEDVKLKVQEAHKGVMNELKKVKEKKEERTKLQRQPSYEIY